MCGRSASTRAGGNLAAVTGAVRLIAATGRQVNAASPVQNGGDDSKQQYPPYRPSYNVGPGRHIPVLRYKPKKKVSTDNHKTVDQSIKEENAKKPETEIENENENENDKERDQESERQIDPDVGDNNDDDGDATDEDDGPGPSSSGPGGVNSSSSSSSSSSSTSSGSTNETNSSFSQHEEGSIGSSEKQQQEQQNKPQEKDLVIQYMKWGLVPSFAKPDSMKNFGYRTINCRAESLNTSPIWRRLTSKKRCVVVLDGFYEWQTQESKHGNKPSKQPYFIYSQKPVNMPSSSRSAIVPQDSSQDLDWPDHEATAKTGGDLVTGGKKPTLLYCAGLYDIWYDQETETKLYSTTIVTTASNSQIGWLHDRMPVILDTAAKVNTWLNVDRFSFEDCIPLLSPYQTSLAWYKVSPVVGNVKNQTIECLESSENIEMRKKKNGIGRFFGVGAAANANTNANKNPKQKKKKKLQDHDDNNDQIASQMSIDDNDNVNPRGQKRKRVFHEEVLETGFDPIKKKTTVLSPSPKKKLKKSPAKKKRVAPPPGQQSLSAFFTAK